jgi:hypothetical protein
LLKATKNKEIHYDVVKLLRIWWLKECGGSGDVVALGDVEAQRMWGLLEMWWILGMWWLRGCGGSGDVVALRDVEAKGM